MLEANEGGVVTADDVASLNRATVSRAAAFARIAGSVMVAVGVLGAAAWLWTVVREQQELTDGYTSVPSGPGDGEISLQERIDVFAATFYYLVFPMLVGGVGLGIRLLADHAVTLAGGSLTGFEVGDELPPEQPVEVSETDEL